jgi:tetratricopeptide (TPR) repeat protein
MRRALSWSLGQGQDSELALRMSAALGEFWYLRTYFGEGRRWLEEALAKSSPAPTAARARALQRVSWLAYPQGDLDRAEVAGEEAAAMFRKQKHTSYLAYALDNLGWTALLRGDSERARALYIESIQLLLDTGDKLSTPENLQGLACVAEARGETERAAKLFAACEALSEAMGTPAEPGESAAGALPCSRPLQTG